MSLLDEDVYTIADTKRLADANVPHGEKIAFLNREIERERYFLRERCALNPQESHAIIAFCKSRLRVIRE